MKPSVKGCIQSRGHGSPLATPGSAPSSIPWIYVCGSPCFGNGLKPPTGSWCGAAQPLYFYFQGGHHSQSLLVGLSHLSEAPFCRGIPPPPPGGPAPLGQTLVGLGSPVICGILPPFHLWWSSKEDNTSATSPCSPGGDLGSLQSLYTS